ncbi:MAG: HNH endonuclease [Pseudomonadota bacterium]
MARQFPLILTLDAHGVPHRWVTWQHACFYYAKERVAWGLGGEAFRIYGGLDRNGNRSCIVATTIIAIQGKAMAAKKFNQVPPLNNHELFRRDYHICAYCGDELAEHKLTRDHIIPFSRGGRDTWMNVVTACRWCNQKKGSRSLEEARLQLLYVPYIPNRAEYLILTNRRILVDQMEFLRQHVSPASRLRTG